MTNNGFHSAALILLAALLVTGCGRDNAAPQPPPGGAPTFAVKTGVATRGAVTEYLAAIGSIVSRLEMEQRSEVAGTIRMIHVGTGVPYAQGDLLVTLDDRDLRIDLTRKQAELERAEAELALIVAGTRAETLDYLRAEVAEAEANLERSETDLTRLRRLFDQDIGSEVELVRIAAEKKANQALLAQAAARLREAVNGARPEDIRIAQAAVAIRRTEVDLATRQLEKTRIHAPFNGVILQKVAEIGAYVSEGDVLFETVSHNFLEAVLEIPERTAGRFAAGAEFSLTVDAFAGTPLVAQIIIAVPVADPASRNMLVRAELIDPPAQLAPGMFVRAQIPINHKDNAVLVPADALVHRKDKIFVFRVVDNKVEMIPASIGLRGKNMVEVLSGIEPGDVVVTTGGEVLFPAASVSIVTD